MLVDFENCESTGKSNIFLPLRGTEDYVIAAGWPAMFTTCMVGAGKPGTGVSTTSSLDVFVGNATLLDTKSDDGEMWDHYYSWEERIED